MKLEDLKKFLSAYYIKINIVLFFGIALPFYTEAQATAYDFSSIDTYASQLPKSQSKSIPALAAALTRTSKNNTEKVRAIFIWLGKNIVYDLQSFKSGNVPEQTAEATFEYRKAVCQGFSELFYRLCKLNHIECAVIPGYSKGYGYKPGKKFKSTDHAWNAVKLDNHWYLIDVTWGGGYIDERDKYIQSTANEYFLPDPKRFILKHLPSDPMWQLLPNPISVSDYEKDSAYIKLLVNLQVNKKNNYLDTLNTWEPLDSVGRIVSSNLRIIQYNPENGDAWYKMGWFYFTLAWQRMAKLNDPSIQKNRSLAKPLAIEATGYLKEAQKYLNEVNKRDPFYGDDVKQKKEVIQQNLKNLEQIINH